MRRFLAVGAALGVFASFGVQNASANGILPVIIHTCDAYKASDPSKAVKTKDGSVIGTYVVTDSNDNVVATADNVEIFTTKSASCIGTVDVEAPQSVINGLLTDELFITVRSCGVIGDDDSSDDSSSSDNTPATCTFGEETVVLTDGEAVDTVLDEALTSINVIVGNLQAQLDQEILDRIAADAALQQSINTNASGIAANASGIATNTTGIATNASGIATNTTGIATNASGIATNTSDIATNASGIATNASGIATNASGIATNASGIATNASGIATNASGIATNASGIATNASGIATNASGIATNASGIVTNATDIATNASGIATNASGIATNASGIATNASGISTNAAGIAANAASIATNTTDLAATNAAVAANTANITTNTGAISTNTAGIASNTTNITTNTSAITTNGNAITLLTSDVSAAQADINSLQMNKQNRVNGVCPLGSAIRLIDPAGNVLCQADSNTQYSAGNGLQLLGNVFSADTNVVQARVIGTCPPGSSIRSINAAGGVVCEADDAGGNDNMGNHTATQNLNMAGFNVNNVNQLNLSNTTNRIRRGNLPSFGQAAAFDPSTLSNGLIIEHGDSESAGIYMDGNTMVMWSPGDQSVLRVYDEDAFGSGPVFEVKGDRTVVGEHRGLVSGATTGYDDDGSQDCPGSRVARGFDADAGTFGAIDRIRLNCAYVK